MIHKRRENKLSYTNIAVPTVLVESVGKIINESALGYRTKTEFIVTAIREKIERETMKEEVSK